MNYTLRQLEVFCTLVKTGSFTRASEVLHLSQPAVSLQYKSFSEQFHFDLLQQQNKRFVLTDFGALVHAEASAILQRVRNLAALNESVQGELVGTLRFSIVSTGKYILPTLLREFLELHPKVRLQMDVTNKDHVLQHLLDNTVDLSLMSLVPDRLALETETLMPNTLVLVCSPSYAEKHRPLDLTKLQFVFREHGSATRKAMEDFLKTSQIEPEYPLELTSNEAVKQSLLAGLGASVLPVIGIRRELNAGLLVELPVKNLPIVTAWHLAWRSNQRLSPVAQAYIDYVREHKERLIKNFD